MKPSAHVKIGTGYCCVQCDGPRSTWKKKQKRALPKYEVIDNTYKLVWEDI